MMSLQPSLFKNSSSPNTDAISGITYIPDYITEEEETSLLNKINKQSWLTELKRRVQHYGWRYDYKARQVDASLKIGDLPEWLQTYTDKLYSAGYFPEIPDQVIVNEYLPGQGISPHIDCVPCFTDTIASLSLGSPCVMEFTHNQTSEKISVLLEPRSLVVMQGDARYLWKHAIPARKTDKLSGKSFTRKIRVSLTFRKVHLYYGY